MLRVKPGSRLVPAVLLGQVKSVAPNYTFLLTEEIHSFVATFILLHLLLTLTDLIMS